MHQGGPDTHKEPGTEVWVYDLATRKRVQRMPMLNPLVSFVGVSRLASDAHARPGASCAGSSSGCCRTPASSASW